MSTEAKLEVESDGAESDKSVAATNNTLEETSKPPEDAHEPSIIPG